MARPCIIRIDSVKRYCDIIEMQPPRKQVYYDLVAETGVRWGNYARFLLCLKLGRKYYGDERKRQFIATYLERMARHYQDEISPRDIFEEINKEYQDLWKSYTLFLKKKSNYRKKGYI